MAAVARTAAMATCLIRLDMASPLGAPGPPLCGTRWKISVRARYPEQKRCGQPTATSRSSGGSPDQLAERSDKSTGGDDKAADVVRGRKLERCGAGTDVGSGI